VHPKYLLDGDDFALLDLWQAWRGSPERPGLWPAAGGALDQPACVLASFSVMDAALEALRPALRTGG